LIRTPNYSTSSSASTSTSRTDVLNETSDGIKIKRIATDSFEVSIKSLRRRAFDSTLVETANQTLEVEESSPLQVKGEKRSGRTMNGGPLVVSHNLLNGVQTEMTANSLLWTLACTCPVAGRWSGKMLDPNNADPAQREILLTLEMISCGRAEFTRENVSTQTKNTLKVGLENCVSP
jgi:hypothetical protein